MVKEVYPEKTFWTLPGGGLEAGETFEEAVIREVKEEVNLVHSLDGKIPTLGFDPEAGNKQTLSDIKWHTFDEMKMDFQVSKMIDSLQLLEYKFF